MKITYYNYTIILNLITLRIVHLSDLLRSKSSLLEYKKTTDDRIIRRIFAVSFFLRQCKNKSLLLKRKTPYEFESYM